MNEPLQACAVFELYKCVVFPPLLSSLVTLQYHGIIAHTVYQFTRSSKCSSYVTGWSLFNFCGHWQAAHGWVPRGVYSLFFTQKIFSEYV
jgi:hypothetical protein